MVVLLIFIFRSIKKLESTARKRLEANLLKEHLNQIENLLKTMQTQKHDHTKHMQTLQAMIYLDEIEEAKNYIDGIAESYWYTDKIKDAGHPALTALLNSKHKIAEIKKIKFDFSVKYNLENIYLLSWDLCSIIGNLLDNAFKAVIENQGNRNVGLEIKSENDDYVIYVINNGPRIAEDIKEKIFQPGYTTKESEGRGYGLYLVKRLVDKYNGKIQAQDNAVFSVLFCHCINMCIPGLLLCCQCYNLWITCSNYFNNALWIYGCKKHRLLRGPHKKGSWLNRHVKRLNRQKQRKIQYKNSITLFITKIEGGRNS